MYVIYLPTSVLYFRGSKDNVDKLCEALEPVIPLGRANHGYNMLPKEKILLFLYSSGTGVSNVHTSDTMECSEGTVRNSIHQVIGACHSPNPLYGGKSFVEDQIRLPTTEEALERGQTFLSMAPFPVEFPPVIIGKKIL